jgi:hypothetical protein
MKIGTIPNINEYKELIDIQSVNYKNGYANRYMVCYIGCGPLGGEVNSFTTTDRLTDYTNNRLAHTVVDLENGQVLFSKPAARNR